MSEAPAKRIRTSLAHARNRLSLVGNTEDGRRSRMSISAPRHPKRNSMPPGRNPLSAAVDFARSDNEHYRIKICFVGNRGCGKTKMLEYVYRTRHRVVMCVKWVWTDSLVFFFAQPFLYWILPKRKCLRPHEVFSLQDRPETDFQFP